MLYTHDLYRSLTTYCRVLQSLQRQLGLRAYTLPKTNLYKPRLFLRQKTWFLYIQIKRDHLCLPDIIQIYKSRRYFFFSREVVINIYKKSRGHLHIKEQVSFLLTIDKSSHYTRQRPVRFSRAEVFKILETRVYIQGQMSHILTQVIQFHKNMTYNTRAEVNSHVRELRFLTNTCNMSKSH